MFSYIFQKVICEIKRQAWLDIIFIKTITADIMYTYT